MEKNAQTQILFQTKFTTSIRTFTTKDEGIEINESTCPFVGNHSFVPNLNDEQRDLCEGQLTYAECFKLLSTFENNKTPGNDGIPIEFYRKILAYYW